MKLSPIVFLVGGVLAAIGVVFGVSGLTLFGALVAIIGVALGVWFKV